MSYDQMVAMQARIAELEMLLARECDARETACRLYADTAAVCAQYKEELLALRRRLEAKDEK